MLSRESVCTKYTFDSGHCEVVLFITYQSGHIYIYILTYISHPYWCEYFIESQDHLNNFTIQVMDTNLGIG